MTKYNLYAGLGGSFGGYQYRCTDTFNNKDEAYDAAYEMAYDTYQAYEGLYGLPTWYDIQKAYCKRENINVSDLTDYDLEYIDSEYDEEIDKWASVLITTIDEDPNHDR